MHPSTTHSTPYPPTSINQSLPTHTSDVEIAFPSAKRAALAMAVLEVDEELQPTKVSKAFALQGPVLRV